MISLTLYAETNEYRHWAFPQKMIRHIQSLYTLNLFTISIFLFFTGTSSSQSQVFLGERQFAVGSSAPGCAPLSRISRQATLHHLSTGLNLCVNLYVEIVIGWQVLVRCDRINVISELMSNITIKSAQKWASRVFCQTIVLRRFIFVVRRLNVIFNSNLDLYSNLKLKLGTNLLHACIRTWKYLLWRVQQWTPVLLAVWAFWARIFHIIFSVNFLQLCWNDDDMFYCTLEIIAFPSTEVIMHLMRNLLCTNVDLKYLVVENWRAQQWAPISNQPPDCPPDC